jgi:uncharacterized protein YecT (DUF1311 family)
MILLLLLALGAPVSVAHDDPLEVACYERDYSQQAMNRCAQEAYQRADQAMNAQWTKVRSAFDETEGAKILLEAQRAWLKYRDKHCEAAAFDSLGGSIWPLINFGCLAAQTRERSRELDELIAAEGQ